MLAAFGGLWLLLFRLATELTLYSIYTHLYVCLYVQLQLQQLLFELANANNCICDFAGLYKDNVQGQHYLTRLLSRRAAVYVSVSVSACVCVLATVTESASVTVTVFVSISA